MVTLKVKRFTERLRVSASTAHIYNRVRILKTKPMFVCLSRQTKLRLAAISKGLELRGWDKASFLCKFFLDLKIVFKFESLRVIWEPQSVQSSTSHVWFYQASEKPCLIFVCLTLALHLKPSIDRLLFGYKECHDSCVTSFGPSSSLFFPRKFLKLQKQSTLWLRNW
jgi:hypothetical protein